ncbi:MAG: carboxymuconolactone decarboxylase family protein [Acidimicrobiales bacterium]
MHGRGAKQAGETDERIATLAAWRDSPYFDDAEKAVLGLVEAATRLADRSGPIPEEVFDAVTKHYDEQAVGVLVVSIAIINTWKRLNVVSGQVAGDWVQAWKE